LIGSIPILGKVMDRLDVIPGNVPNLVNLPSGCRFAPRCRLREKYNLNICTQHEPELFDHLPGHSVRCWLYTSSESHTAPLAVK
jgi:oligopeptide/dipeptide ABC transporter ATP-binding protein